MARNRLFQLAFAVFVRKFKEVKRVFVFDREFCLIPNVLWERGVEVSLIEQRLFVGPVFDLVNQNVLAPSELLGPLKVELALGRLLAPLNDQQILGPANFSHQWCEFFILRVRFVELLDSPQVSREKPPTPGDSTRRSLARSSTAARPQVSPCCR